MKRPATAKLTYEDEVYTPMGAKSLTYKELRAEYSRLRSIARKRLERFEGTEWTDTQVYRLNKGKYKPVKEIKNEAEMRYLLSEVARYVTAETSSVSGLKIQRAEALQSLHEHGYEFVNKSNFKEFAQFMEDARIRNISHMYDSKRTAEWFEANEKKYRSAANMSKAFYKWQTEQEEKGRIQHQQAKASSLYRQGYNKGRGKQ